MDLQTYLNNAVLASRAKTFAQSDQLSLGELILKLEPIAARQEEGEDEAQVYFDFGGLYPTKLTSWRGIYTELALCFAGASYDDPEALTVSGFLKMCREAIGKTFEGYKGGDFVMGRGTPVWVANWGRTGTTALIDVVDAGYMVYLVTGMRES